MTQPPIDHHLAYIMEQLDTIKSNQEAIMNKQDEINNLREYMRGLSIAVQELCRIIKEAQEEDLVDKDDIIIYKHDRHSRNP